MAELEPMRLVPTEVIKDAWVALVPALDHPLGHCVGTVHRDGSRTHEQTEHRCFTCAALEALQPYHHGEVGRVRVAPESEAGNVKHRDGITCDSQGNPLWQEVR